MFILERTYCWVALKTQPLKILRISCHLSNDSLVISEIPVTLGMWYQKPNVLNIIDMKGVPDGSSNRSFQSVYFVRRHCNSPFFLLSSGLGVAAVAWFCLRASSHTWESILKFIYVIVCEVRRQWDVFCGWRKVTRDPARTRPSAQLWSFTWEWNSLLVSTW